MLGEMNGMGGFLKKVLWSSYLLLPCVVFADQISFLGLGENSYWQVWLLDSESKDIKQLTASPYDKSTHSWFLDGKHLLVNGNQGQLVKLDVSTGEEIPIDMPIQGTNDAVLSPDGKTIAFSYSTSESINDNNLWLYTLETKRMRKLTNLTSLQYEPSWSSDGKKLYFVSATSSLEQDLWVVDVAKGDKKQLTVGSMFNMNVAESSSNGLVYSSNRTGNYELWWKEEGNKIRKVTNNPSLDGSPSWLNSGKKVVYESYRGGVANIFSLNLETISEEKLTSFKDGARKQVVYRSAGVSE
jgi:TolB protein